MSKITYDMVRQSPEIRTYIEENYETVFPAAR